MSLANYLYNRQQHQSDSGRPTAKKWLYFAEHARARLSGAGCFSLSLHIALFFGYLAIASLTEVEVVEIQEVTFIDLTEEPRKISVPKEDIGLGLKIAKAAPAPEPVVEDVAESGIDAPEVAEISIPEPEKPKVPIQIEPAASATSTKLKPSNLLAFSAPASSGGDKIMVSSSKVKLDRRDQRTGTSAISLANSSGDKKPRIALASHTPISVSPGQTGPYSGGQGSGGGSSDLMMGSGRGKVNITGPLANRDIIRKMMPPFPQWAKRKGVGATIALRFTVMEDGTIKENIVVERTSGSREWDHMVIDALRKWQFAPLGEIGRRFDQNGVITFHFVIT